MEIILFAAAIGFVSWLAYKIQRTKHPKRDRYSEDFPASWSTHIMSLDTNDTFPASYQDTLELMVATNEEIEDEAASYALFALYSVENATTSDLIVDVISPVGTTHSFKPTYEDGVLVGVELAGK